MTQMPLFKPVEETTHLDAKERAEVICKVLDLMLHDRATGQISVPTYRAAVRQHLKAQIETAEKRGYEDAFDTIVAMLRSFSPDSGNVNQSGSFFADWLNSQREIVETFEPVSGAV